MNVYNNPLIQKKGSVINSISNFSVSCLSHLPSVKLDALEKRVALAALVVFASITTVSPGIFYAAQAAGVVAAVMYVRERNKGILFTRQLAEKDAEIAQLRSLNNEQTNLLDQQKHIKAKASFDSYVKYFASQKIDAVEMANRGDRLLSLIFQGASVLEKDPDAVACIVWACMRQACRKGQDFTEGAFVIKDPQGLLAQYMKNVGYDRSSSHLKGRTSPTKTWLNWQTGMDIDHGLPASHTTVLFSPIDLNTRQQAFFLKPEAHGCDPTKPLDLFNHALGYAASLWRINQVGANEQVNMRKERVILEQIREFETLVSSYVGSLDPLTISSIMREFTELDRFAPAETNEAFFVQLADAVEQHIKKAKVYGIQYMWQFVSHPDVQRKVPAAAAFKEALEKFDHYEMRTGNEVILSESDFRSAL